MAFYPDAGTLLPTDQFLIYQNDAQVHGLTSAEMANIIAPYLGGQSGVIPPLPFNTVISMASGDYLFGYVGAAESWITVSNMIASQGQTISAGTAAAAASGTDTFWCAQGGSSLVVQSLSGVWTWIQNQLPSFKAPTMAVSGPITLDTTLNRLTLVAVGATTINPPPTFGNVGDGFQCEILTQGFNVTIATSAGPVLLVTSTGATVFAAGIAQVRATSAGGTNMIMVNLPASAGTTAQTITIAPIGSQQPNTTFTVNGGLGGYSAPPTLSYAVNGGSYTSISSGGVTTTTFTFNVTGGIAAGASNTISVKDANGVLATSNVFAVTSSPILTLTAPPAELPATSFTLNGTAANYTVGSAPTACDVSFNNGSTYTLTNLSNTGAGATFTITIASGSVPAAGSYQVVVRDTNATSIISNAQTLIVEAASLASVPTTGTSGVAITGATYSLTGITTAYAALWNGTADQGSRVTITGSSGSMPSFTPASAGTYTLRIYDAASSGNKLAESASITVAAGSVNTTMVSVIPAAVGSIGAAMTFNFTYTGTDPTTLQASIAGGSFSSISCTASGGSGTFSVTPSGTAGSSTISIKDAAGANGTKTSAFYAQASGAPFWTYSSAGTEFTTPVSHSAADTCLLYFTGTGSNTAGSDFPATTGQRTWFAAWSHSQVLPPSGTNWPSSGPPTGSMVGSCTGYYPGYLGHSPNWLQWASNPTNSAGTWYAWFCSPNGYIYVHPFQVTST